MQDPLLPSEKISNEPEHQSRATRSKAYAIGGVVAAAVVLIIALGGYLVLRSDDSKSDKAANNGPTNNGRVLEPALVRITKNGYEPATIAVLKGQTLTWTNFDTKPHHVANTPTKDKSMEFATPAILEKGDAFSTVFDKAGTYTYYDENNTKSYQGTVIVK